MFNLSKNLIGVEKRKDGTLLYQGRGVLAFLGKKKSIYVINKRTYNFLKLFVIVQLFTIIPFLAWHKANYSPLRFTDFCLLLIGAFTLAEIEWRLIDNFVANRSKKIDEK